MADLIGNWCAMFAYSGLKIAAHQFAAASQFAPFLKAGWLATAGSPNALFCEACDEPQLADLEQIDTEVRGICWRTGDTFPISNHGCLHRVDGDAFARSLALALRLNGDARLVRGYERVWALGDGRLNETRIMLFLTPAFGQIDVATTVLQAVAAQSRAKHFCLIVADDIDDVRLLQRKGAVVRLRDIATIEPDGTLIIDHAQLLVEIFPYVHTPRRRGRPADQRERILQLLDEFANNGLRVDGSNECIREIGLKYKKRFKDKRRPAPDTIRKAIANWNARCGF